MHPLRTYRRAKGLTLKELGEALGVAYQTAQGWEIGRQPHPGNLRDLAQLLEVDPRHLQEQITIWRREKLGLPD
ncbi:MAG TPA: helix-turn-helix transcriptional regulator [Chloroflexota bacterium]|jgi:transcriptional regulator with XRE-family HTH domain